MATLAEKHDIPTKAAAKPPVERTGWKNRKTRRYSWRLPILKINDVAVENAAMVDISPLGVRIEAPTAAPPNTAIYLTFRMPEMEQPLTLAGVVRWIRPAPPYGARFFMGIEWYIPQWEIDLLVRHLEGLVPLS